MYKLFTLGAILLSAVIGRAQTFADKLIASGPCEPIVAVTCPSGVENPGYLVDGNFENYALLKTNLGLSLVQSRAFIEVGFSTYGAPASDIAIVIEKLDQSLNVDVVDNINVIVFDTLGNEVAHREDLNLQDVAALGGSSSRQIIKFSTPPGNYVIGKVRIELVAVANVLQTLAVYSVSHNVSCPPIVANTLVSSANTTTPEGAVDTDTATFATFNLPVSLFSNTASLAVAFPEAPVKGDYVGFEIAKNNTLLQLSLIDSLSLSFFAADSTELFKKSDFSTADLIAADQLAGVLGPVLGIGGSLNQRYIIGTMVPSTVTTPIAYVKLELGSTIGLLTDLNIYNAFYFSQFNGIRITADKVGIIDGKPVTLTADNGFSNYSWSNGAATQSTVVTTAGVYTVAVNRFDGCQLKGSYNVRSLDCSNGRIMGDSVFAYGNCDPQVPLLCPSGVQDPGFAVDNDPNSYALLSASLGVSLIESTAFLDLNFNKSGDAGSDVGVIIEPINQNLNADVVDNLTIVVYDEAGNEVMRKSDVDLKNVGLLSGTASRAVLTVRTPVGNYRIKRVRVELEGVANVLQDLAVYGMYYDCACPPILANTVINSTNTVNPELAVDADNSNFAIMSLPVSLGNTATLEVGFSQNVVAGDYVGFQVEPDNDALSLGLLDQLEVAVFDENGVQRANYTDFNLANVVSAEQLGGTVGGILGAGGAGTAPTVIGFQTDTGNYRIASIKLTMNPTIGLLPNLRVYNAFSLSQLMGVQITASDTAVCNGVNITLSAPVGYDDYLWSTGATTQTITVTEAGQYSVTIYRTDGCALSGSFFLKTRSFDATFGSVKPDCGQSNGSAYVDVTGGSGSYSYNWSNGATTDSLTNLSAGNYSVIVTDNIFGCVDTFSFVLSNANTDFIGYVRNSDCGQNNGAIYVTLPQGATILWDNGSTNPFQYGLSAGKYTATVTFANGCIGTQTFTVLDYQNFNLSAVVTSANCVLDNGAIDLTVGASGNYSFLWSNDATTEDISNLAPDLYSVIVTNTTTGCQDGLRRSISDQGSPTITLVDLKEETCARQQNGRIEIDYIPADSNYTVLWNTHDTTKATENLGPGIYKVFVTNGLGCQGTRDFELVARDSINILLFSTPSVCVAPFTGTVTSLVTGGRAPYEYLYNTGDTTKHLSAVAPGDYSLQIIDTNGCVMVGNTTVDRAPECDEDTTTRPRARASQLITPNGDGYNDTFKTELINDYPFNHVEIFSRDGVMVFETDNYKNEWGGTYRKSSSLLPDGTYFWVFSTTQGGKKEFRGFVVIKH